MCGIFGIFNQHGAIPEGVLANAARHLAHRGPDDSGTVVLDTASNGQLGLAHTRLSIIDLSPLGHQPMSDPLTGNCIVYNGEIYNFRDLRTELESTGHRFQSQSDTEVILAAYRAWGFGSFSRLRGMFAFALWDARAQTLLLVRDPMGIKPLYYSESSGKFLFASEVRTLLQTGLMPRKLDPNGFFRFLAFGSVYEPHTIAEGVFAVPPGHVVSVKGNSIQSREFSMPFTNDDSSVDRSPDNASARNANDDLAPHRSANALRSLPDLLRSAVLSHLVSDVPVGVFLSGGIDSSSIVALMSHAGVRPATFSLVFKEEEFNEAPYSRLIARRFSTDHHETAVSEEDALAGLPEALRAMDQPTIDGINAWLVSSKARAAGVKVALTGLGADELFAGYSNFRRVPQMERAAARFAKLPSAVRKPVAASIALVAEKSDRSRKLSSLAHGEDLTHPYFLARTLFSPQQRRALYAGESEGPEAELRKMEQASIAACQAFDPINRVSYLESSCYMRNTLLRDSDFMSMAHGLELRVPFLDIALVRACFQIPGAEKLRGNSPKSLLLKNLGVQLPREIVHRPKRGFTFPFERWMRGKMKSHVEQALHPQNVLTSYLNPRAVFSVWNRFLAGRTSWSRPWSLFVLQKWCEHNL